MARHAHDREPSDAPAAAVDAARAASPATEASRARSGRKQQSERSCIVTRAVLAPDELIRFVLSPQNLVVPDVRRALPGRGVWVTASRARIDEACRRKAFGRAFKREVTTPVDLAEQVGSLIRKDALQALSLANKAGALTAGFEKTRAALEDGEALALIEASDGSADGRRKLIAALRRNERSADGESLPAESATLEPAIIDCFASSELDLALGRPHVIHAALLRAPAGGFALRRCLRLHRFELIEKHASGGAERCGAARESRNPNRQTFTAVK
jgi:uncharacterized protein